MVMLGTFKPPTTSSMAVLPVAIGSLLSVAFMNLNLSHNSVGFYQLSKLACIPFTLLIQYIETRQAVPMNILLTLLPILFGVGYATVYDVSVNLYGTVIATLAVIATSVSQILTNKYQNQPRRDDDEKVDALQLLYLTSPMTAIGMLIMCPFFDDVTALANHEYTSPCAIRIAITCVLALGVNITNYSVIGSTSPLTYQVLGHLKTILIIILGFVCFNKHADMRNLIGITIAMGGVIAYTELKRRQSAPSQAISSSKFIDSDKSEKP
jgi:solute carrier family 35 protein E3